MYQKFQLHFIHYQLKVSGEEKSMPNESLNYIPMLSVFRTPSCVQHWGFPSHVQCGCHQWPYISLHLVGTSWSAENPPRAPSNTEQRSSRSPCSPQVLTSSQTSRTAATLGSSSGSMPPPGTIHRSGWRLLLTSSTCREQSTADGWTHSNTPSQSPAAGGEVSLSLSHLQPNSQSLEMLRSSQGNFFTPLQAAVQAACSLPTRHSSTLNYFNHYLLVALEHWRIN